MGVPPRFLDIQSFTTSIDFCDYNSSFLRSTALKAVLDLISKHRAVFFNSLVGFGKSNIVFLVFICNGKSTEWSSVRYVIIRVITKSDECAAGVRFVFITTRITGPIGRHEVLFPINHKNYNFPEKKNSQVLKERENLH